jgi:hypothetical protein
MREFYKYKAYYCGLCKVLRDKFGLVGQVTLTYDMTFLVILLTSLYESESQRKEFRCIVHPMKKQKMLYNEITEYAAEMNLILTYYKLLDDWQDEKSKKSYAGYVALRKIFKKLQAKYPEKCEVIRENLALLKQCEERNVTSVDEVSRCFGQLMGELFVWNKDCWEEQLRMTGFYLGKFIYILDAYDDLERDQKTGSYNVLLSQSEEEGFHGKVEEMLNYILAECTNEFEKLPCVEDVEILRNILYAGVWEKFNSRRKERESE